MDEMGERWGYWMPYGVGAGKKNRKIVLKRPENNPGSFWKSVKGLGGHLCPKLPRISLSLPTALHCNYYRPIQHVMV